MPAGVLVPVVALEAKTIRLCARKASTAHFHAATKKCDTAAMRASFPSAKRIDCGQITLAVHEAGAGPAVVFCHGFPELAYSWRAQFAPLQAAGYRVIAPDQRGYGGSDKPHEASDYGIFHLIDDLCGMLDALGEQDAVFVGHDWGALLLWQMALLKPERMRALINLNIPFTPRRAIDPMIMARQMLGDDFYIVNFQDSDEADRAFDADPRRFLAAMFRRLPTTRAAFNESKPEQRQAFSMLREMRKKTFPGTPLLSDEELDIYVDAYSAGGFSGPINWYRNWTANWAATADVEQQVRIPTLFIGAQDDVLIAPAHIETMKSHVQDLEIQIIENCGHWTQQEQPDRCNALILDFLARRCPVA